MARRGHINATKFGLMGALLGGFKFVLDYNTQKRAEEAEIAKEQRLAAIQAAQAERAHQLDTERLRLGHDLDMTEIEKRDALERERLGMSQEFAATENEKNRGAQFALEDKRTANDRELAEYNARLHRGNTAFDETFRARMGGSASPDGIYGSDGKFYPKGTPLPQGVTPQVGFGATNLGMRGSAQQGYVSPRSGAAPATQGPVAQVPTPSPMATMPRPSSQAEYAQLPSGTSYLAPDGTIRVKP